MSLVKIKNVTQGKLVFLAVRGADDCPLTLDAGEEKSVFPSMVTQPSLQRVLGTKVVLVDDVATTVAPPKQVAPPVEIAPPPPPPVEVVPVVAEVVEETTPVVEETPTVSTENNFFSKPRKNSRR
jgi:hypothetical protein